MQKAIQRNKKFSTKLQKNHKKSRKRNASGFYMLRKSLDKLIHRHFTIFDNNEVAGNLRTVAVLQEIFEGVVTLGTQL